MLNLSKKMYGDILFIKNEYIGLWKKIDNIPNILSLNAILDVVKDRIFRAEELVDDEKGEDIFTGLIDGIYSLMHSIIKRLIPYDKELK
jgi:hypothetical protein